MTGPPLAPCSCSRTLQVSTGSVITCARQREWCGSVSAAMWLTRASLRHLSTHLSHAGRGCGGSKRLVKGEGLDFRYCLSLMVADQWWHSGCWGLSRRLQGAARAAVNRGAVAGRGGGVGRRGGAAGRDSKAAARRSPPLRPAAHAGGTVHRVIELSGHSSICWAFGAALLTPRSRLDFDCVSCATAREAWARAWACSCICPMGRQVPGGAGRRSSSRKPSTGRWDLHAVM